MRIYLADLGHNQLTISFDIYTVEIANLSVYAQEYLNIKEPTRISLLREPPDLRIALDDAPPDVLGLRSYSRNHEPPQSNASHVKARSPTILNLMGGPNISLTYVEQVRF